MHPALPSVVIRRRRGHSYLIIHLELGELSPAFDGLCPGRFRSDRMGGKVNLAETARGGIEADPATKP